MPMNSTSTLSEPVLEAQPAPPPERAAVARPFDRVEAVLLTIAAIFFALHFMHLRADFPNHSVWMDWAKYTDEGWYGDAAIRHYQLGHWNVPGDFNPAAALPIWPLVEMALFRFTGVSVVAARALTVVVFGLILACSYLLVRRWPESWGRGRESDWELPRRSLAPAIAVMLLSVSPFCFAFMRLAILEPLLILLMLAALLAASLAGRAQWSGESVREMLRERQNLPAAGWAIALGSLLALIVLTKTTGVFLFPAIFWMVWGATGNRMKASFRVALVACGVAAVVWGGYYWLFVRPHFLVDYRYLFSANAYTGATLATLPRVLQNTFRDGAWIGKGLFRLAVASMVVSLAIVGLRRFRGNPLPGAMLLWILGYASFLAYHANLQPRYYLVIAIPLTMLLAIEFDALLDAAIGRYDLGGNWRPWLLRIAAAVSGATLVFAAISGARKTIHFVRHPEYTFLSAAHRVHDAVEREVAVDPHHSRMVLSISGSDISLMTGLPSICDDFGTMTLPDRLATYKPGWFATWNDVEDDKMEALAPMYRLVRVAAIPAFDDPDRNLLILYRLDAVSSPGRSRRPGRRRYLSIPPRSRVKLGAQPSAQKSQN
jgi:4-amino-4-deoxy-L-arabinose transferase-like glycosyltransferase